MKDYLGRALRDPDRWVHSDHQRDNWLLWAKYYALGAAAVFTFIVIAIGVWVRG